MAGQLYALQSDVDMLTKDVHELKRSYNSVDYIAHIMKNLWDEQVCQGAQMRRMETDIAGLKIDVAGLKTDVAGLKTTVARIEKTLLKIEQIVAK